MPARHDQTNVLLNLTSLVTTRIGQRLGFASCISPLKAALIYGGYFPSCCASRAAAWLTAMIVLNIARQVTTYLALRYYAVDRDGICPIRSLYVLCG
jgi:hypothetical protein